MNAGGDRHGTEASKEQKDHPDDGVHLCLLMRRRAPHWSG
jgi:hypothetical protein